MRNFLHLSKIQSPFSKGGKIPGKGKELVKFEDNELKKSKSFLEGGIERLEITDAVRSD